MAPQHGTDDGPSTSAPAPPTHVTGIKRKRKTKDEKERAARIRRGPGLDIRRIPDKKLRGKLKHAERIVREAQEKAIKINEWLLPEDAGTLEAEGTERTWNFKQEDIVRHVEVGAARKAFDLELAELGPYSLDFSRSGRYMLLGGRKGHLALMDWQASRLVCEVQVAETTRDVKFLHNETFFAAAQKKYVYIYDKRGLEVHCLKEHSVVNKLEFLPHHFLLASVGETGVLRYQDTSTGAIVAQHKTKLGPCHVMRANPHNAVLCLGHVAGSMTMWTPNITTPVVKMLCHRGPITALAVDTPGRHMVTAGADGQVKVWDLRMLRPLHAYFSPSPATCLDISQRGMLGVGWGRRVQVWKDALSTKAASPYMNHHLLGGPLEDFSFCPYEDIMGIGHAGGVSSILVPGAGEPNFDSFVANPFQSKRERREQEVVALLDKLQPDTIMLEPEAFARVQREPSEVQKERQEAGTAANLARKRAAQAAAEERTKMKGKNKPTRKHRKKQDNVIEERKPGVQQRMKEEAERRAAAKAQQPEVPEEVPRALHRFYKKA